MKSIFLDTDIIIDFISDRKPFSIDAEKIFSLIDQKVVQGYTSSLCFSNLYYVLTKHASHNKVVSKLKDLSEILGVLTVDDKIINEALSSQFKDFEDAIQHYTAIENKHIDILITRNIKDYKTASLPVMTPDNFLKTLSQADSS